VSAGRVAATFLALAAVAGCQAGADDPTPFSTPSKERPAGVPQSTLSDGDIDGDDGI
jgi:hypothetical protein